VVAKAEAGSLEPNFSQQNIELFVPPSAVR
jgi:hypothetical protein